MIRDALDLRPIRDGGRREIPWEALDIAALAPDARRTLGEDWRARMVQEHLAVGAFSQVALELCAQGCDSVVLALVTRAAADEVRHADLCRRLAVAFLGESQVPARLRGVPKIPAHAEATAADRVLLHVTEMSCLSETLTSVYFAEALARAEDPVLRAAIESLLEDEVDHGRLGWAYLASRRDELGILRDALPRMLERTMGEVLGWRGAPASDGAGLDRFGHLARKDAGDLFGDALRSVILPGFEQLGVDLSAVLRFSKERGWP